MRTLSEDISGRLDEMERGWLRIPLVIFLFILLILPMYIFFWAIHIIEVALIGITDGFIETMQGLEDWLKMLAPPKKDALGWREEYALGWREECEEK